MLAPTAVQPTAAADAACSCCKAHGWWPEPVVSMYIYIILSLHYSTQRIDGALSSPLYGHLARL